MTTKLPRLVFHTIRPLLMLAAAVATSTAGCREVRPPVPELPPLGPGSIARMAIPGATVTEPTIASRPPLVAIAFATIDSRGALIYLTTSDNNGATFAEPEPVAGPRPAPRYEHLRLSFVSPESPAGSGRPSLKLEWQSADGHVLSHTVQPWSRSAAGNAARTPTSTTAPPAFTTSCSDRGEALFTGADQPPVPINHSMADEACVSGEVAAVADSRAWIHAAWIGRSEESADPHLFYASSPHGNGFGFSQVLADNRPNPSHLRVVTDPNETIVTVWDQEGEQRKEVWLRQLIPSHFGPATLLPLTRLSGPDGGASPALASVRGGVMAAWVVPDSGSLAIRRVGLDALCAEPPVERADAASPAANAPQASVPPVRSEGRD